MAGDMRMGDVRRLFSGRSSSGGEKRNRARELIGSIISLPGSHVRDRFEALAADLPVDTTPSISINWPEGHEARFVSK